MNETSLIQFLTRMVEWALQGFQNIVSAVVNAISGNASRLFSTLLNFSWKGILAVILVAGCALNIIIYMQRCKPHWCWFARKRMIVNDSLVESKKKKANSTAAPRRKPSTYIPDRVSQTGQKRTDALAPDDDLFGTDSDLMRTGQKKKTTRKAH